MTTRRWIELRVPAGVEGVEAVSEILTRVGHQGIAVDLPVEPRGGTDHTVKAYLLVDGETVAKVNDVREALGHLQAFDLGPIGELEAREIEEEDWLEAWKAQFTSIRSLSKRRARTRTATASRSRSVAAARPTCPADSTS